MSDMS